MRRYQNVVLGAVGILLGGVTLAAGLVAWAFGGMCGNQVVRRVASPDRRWDAVVFERDCGATTDFSTQVSIVPAGRSLPDAAGNVLVAEGGPPGPGGGPLIDVAWEGSAVLHVRRYPQTRVKRAEREARGVRAVHETIRAPGG